ncbi:MAG: hypothetical protein H7A45_18195 [Verrucomicrobiales bacterium]|nr:hypothetical protein [Verrucomicrobiales bacterium]MCP5525494.1 hypothetical protein [Verrucomicrobiales bacterium]
MKLRTDLLKHLREEDLQEAARNTVLRYEPEPLFSKTGVGSLSSASTEERANEVAHNTALIRKLKRRARRGGKPSDSGS